MILFIGLPIISTGIQSFYAQHDQILVNVKKCDPFGCKESVVVDQEATSKIRQEKPLGKFNGFKTYIDRNHLATDQVSEFWKESKSFGEFISKVGNLPFYNLYDINYDFSNDAKGTFPKFMDNSILFGGGTIGI